MASNRRFRLNWNFFRRAAWAPSEIKTPWHARVRGKVRRAIHSLFVFHSPAWTSNLGSMVTPPNSELTFSQYFNPFFWVVWSGRFMFDWLLSRPYRSFAPAIPTILISMLLLGLFFEIEYKKVSARQNAYRLAFVNAIVAKDFDTASVALGALADLDPLDLSYRYQRAAIDAERGEKENARAQMLRLAAGRQYSEAALWLVKNELDLKNMGEWKEEQHKNFLDWTEIALKSDNEKILLPAKTLMASYLLGIGSLAESLRYFSELTTTNPEFAFTTAMICRQLGDTARTKSFANQARRYYDAKLKQSPKDRTIRVSLAKTLIVLNEEREAAQLLIDGFELSMKQDQELRIASGEALAVYSNRLAELPPSPELLMERLQVLRGALEIAADCPAVNDAITGVLFQCRSNQNKEVQVLREALVKGIDPDSAHFIRGTLALLDKNYADAKVHLELAGKFSKNLPGVLNNLAVTMSHMENGELESALSFSNAALESLPDHPYFRDTRGQILLKLGRFREAIGDLEFALRAPELAGAVHKSLAAAYEGLGQADLAESHRQLAAQTK